MRAPHRHALLVCATSRVLDSSETNLSAEQSEAQAAPRVSCPDGDEGGTENHQEPARQAAPQTERLSFASPAAGLPGPFPRACRLTRARDFRRVFAKPIRSTGHGLQVLARGNGRGGARLGMAIPRRRVRRAVCRNRIKRVIRESFRVHRAELAGLDLVVLARSGLDRVSNAELRRLLADHWRRLSRRRPQPTTG